MIADRELYWNGPKDDTSRKIVEESDPTQAYLCIHKGAEVTPQFLDETGCKFVGGKLVTPDQQTEAKPKGKAKDDKKEGETE